MNNWDRIKMERERVKALLTSINEICIEHDDEHSKNILELIDNFNANATKSSKLSILYIFNVETIEDLKEGMEVNYADVLLRYNEYTKSDKLQTPPFGRYKMMGFTLEEDSVNKKFVFKSLDKAKYDEYWMKQRKHNKAYHARKKLEVEE